MTKIRQSTALILSVSLLFILFQNCSAYHEANSFSSTSPLDDNNDESISIFEITLKPLLQECSACHGVNQLPLFAVADSKMSHNTLLQFSLVNLAAPSSSRIVQQIRGGHQTFSSSLANDLEDQIAAWASAIEENETSPDDESPQLEPTFSSIHSLILVPKCVSCHSATGERPQEDYTSYLSTIETVIPGDPVGSLLYAQCLFGEMPKGNPMLSADELAALRDWIDMGALNN